MSWGLKNRLSRIIQKDGRTLMFAVDHGYFLGAITGIKQPKKMLDKIVPYADAVMLTRGMVNSALRYDTSQPIILRADGGPSIAAEKNNSNKLSNHEIMITLEDAVKLNASAVAISIFVGTKHETQTMNNLSRMVSEAEKYGMPVLAVTAVGAELDAMKAQSNKKDKEKFRQYLTLACRMASEHGAHLVKTYYCKEGFSEVTGSCLVPVVMAGGKAGDPLGALKETYEAVKGGAIGVDMGRNIFQSVNPVAMIKSVRSVIHEGYRPNKAFKLYKSLL